MSVSKVPPPPPSTVKSVTPPPPPQEEKKTTVPISTPPPSSRKKKVAPPPPSSVQEVISTPQEEFYSISEEVKIPRQRAAQAVEQTQIRTTFPAETRFIPSSQRLSVTEAETIRQPPPPPLQQERTISAGFERRIGTLIEREERLERGKQALYEGLGIQKQEGDSYLIGLGKTIARTPFEIGSMPVYYGGRAAFAAESLFDERGRGELIRAGKETPSAVISSYDIRQPEGLVNLGLTAFAIKGTAGAIKTARTKPSFIVEESVTMRTTTPEITSDITKVKIEAAVGKKIFKGFGESEQTFIDVVPEQGLFEVKGSGKFNIGTKKTTFETGGFGVSTEEGTILSSKTTTGKGKTYLSVTETSPLIKEPIQMFKGLDITQEITRTGAKPSVVSAFSTKELYVEDLFKGTGQSMFRKNIVGESGQPIATEQLLGTQKISVGAKEFNLAFEGRRNIGTERAVQNVEIIKETRPEFTSGGGRQRVALETRVSSQSMQNILKQELVGKIGTETKLDVLKTSLIPKTATTTQTRQKQVSINKELSFNPKSAQITSTKPFSINKPAVSTKQEGKILLETKFGDLILKQKQGLQVKPMMKQSVSTKFQTPTMNIFSFSNAPISSGGSSFILPPLSFSGISGSISGSRRKPSRKGGKQARKYRPSILGLVSGTKRGKRTGKGILTGFEIRGI